MDHLDFMVPFSLLPRPRKDPNNVGGYLTEEELVEERQNTRMMGERRGCPWLTCQTHHETRTTPPV